MPNPDRLSQGSAAGDGQPPIDSAIIQFDLLNWQFKRVVGLAALQVAAAALLLLYHFGQSVNRGLPVWLAGLVLCALVVPVVVNVFARRGGDGGRDGLLTARSILLAFVIVSAALWCYGLSTTTDETSHWLLTAILCALALGAAHMLAAMPYAMVAGYLPVLLVSAAMHIMRREPAELFAAGFVIAVAVVALLLCWRYRRQLVRDLLARRHAEQLRTQLQEQSEELVRLGKLKDYFLAAISYDLRQPAQAIGLLSQGLHEATRHSTAHTQAAALLRASDRINDLISRLVDLARLDFDRNKPDERWVNVQAVFSHLAPALLVKARHADLALRFGDQQFSVRADPIFVERILQNLIVNAIDHANASIVSIEAKVRDPIGDKLSLLVVDNGVGLDHKRCEAVMRPAGLAEKTGEATRSLQGMGLSIATRLARLGGYQLEVYATPGEGTCFELKFDHWRGDRTLTQPKTEAASDSQIIPIERARQRLRKSRLQVLIIEDDVLVRVGLLSLIANAGFEVTACDSGADALDAIRNDGCHPDIIVADWYLANGVTAATALPVVQASLPAAVPVIILTGQQAVGVSDADLSGQVGQVAVRFLHKPVRVELLVRCIRELLDEAASQ